MKTAGQMPALFLAHGSPMNAIESNEFTETLVRMGQELPTPKAILCISAHWMTPGFTAVTAMARPKTIHDFYGFPQALFDCQYPAPGSPELANEIKKHISSPTIELDQEWGLDHGTWSVLLHAYREAQIPVVQLSLDLQQPGSYHLEMGKKLNFLREQGVLIVGSGNIVHNLRRLSAEGSPAPDWAVAFDAWVKTHIERRDFAPLATHFQEVEGGRLSVPTVEHYLPLLYILGASTPEDSLSFDYEGFQLGSLSMRCVRFG